MERLRVALLQLIRRPYAPMHADAKACVPDEGMLREISRRVFLKLSAGAAFAGIPLLRSLETATKDSWADRHVPSMLPSDSTPLPSFQFIELLRYEDLINL